MANKSQLETAKQIFEAEPQLQRLYLNPKGEFFTKIDYAQNSVEDTKKIETLTRKDALKEETKENVEPLNTEGNE